MRWRRKREPKDFSDEIDAHLALETERLIAGGASPRAARDEALRRFGNVTAAQERFYESRRFMWFEDVRRDIAYALRALRRSPGFTIVAILTLALGIGANTVVFSGVNAILLRPLPYTDPDRLVHIIENIPGAESMSGGPERSASMTTDNFQEWRRRTKTLSHMALEMPVSMTLTGSQDALRLHGAKVSPAMFPMLGVRPVLGRVFEPREEKPGLDRVVILSYGTWQRDFGADAKIVGRLLTFDNTAYAVVGVTPRGFAFPDPGTKFWMPLPLSAPKPGQFMSFLVTARLRDGTSLAAAAAEANTISRELRGEVQTVASHPRRMEIVSWKDEMVAPIRPAVSIFVVAVGLVLLIACVNVANLFLARATTRHREMATRIALGAGRKRLVRQLLTESFVLALLGGTLGVILAVVGNRLLSALGNSLSRLDLLRFEAAGNTIPRLNEISIDTTVLLYVLGVTMVTGLVFGLGAAAAARRVNPMHATVLRAVSAPSGLRLRSTRGILVAGQVALTMVLLIGAGLLIRSFVKLTSVELGFDPTNVLTFKIPQPQLFYPQDVGKQAQQTSFAEAVVARLRSVPGIHSAAFTSGLPMVQASALLSLSATPGAAATPIPRGNVLTVSREYLRVMGIRVVAGRGFDESDHSGQRPVYVINKALAKEFFRGDNPIGKTLSGDGLRAGEVVGIIDDTRQFALDTEPEPQLLEDPEHVVGLIPVTPGGVYFAIRTQKDAAAIIPEIRSIVRTLDPSMALDDIAMMDEIVANSITTPRAYAVLLGAFSAIALALATIGLYGVLAYLVAQRTHEIGIRVALGARGAEVLLLVLKQGLAVTLFGVTLGVAGSLVAMRSLEKMLFGLASVDPVTYLIAVGIFVLVALAACCLPARHALRVDPFVALRHE